MKVLLFPLFSRFSDNLCDSLSFFSLFPLFPLFPPVATFTSSFHSQAHGNYDFGYGIKDDNHGSESFHKESGDHANNKWGSYGLRDADGRWRIVNYVADKHGFRAAIQSNEPGVASVNSAHVSVNEPMHAYGHEDGGHHHSPLSEPIHEPLHHGYLDHNSHAKYPHEDSYHNDDDHYNDIGHRVDDNLHLGVPAIDSPIPGLDAIPIAAAADTSSSTSKVQPEGKRANSSNSSKSEAVVHDESNITTNRTVKPTMNGESAEMKAKVSPVTHAVPSSTTSPSPSASLSPSASASAAAAVTKEKVGPSNREKKQK